MLPADPLDLEQGAEISTADEHHPSLELAGFELANDIDRIRLAERQIQEDQVGFAGFELAQKGGGIDERPRVDAEAGQHLAKHHAEPRLVVEHEGEAHVEMICCCIHGDGPREVERKACRSRPKH